VTVKRAERDNVGSYLALNVDTAKCCSFRGLEQLCRLSTAGQANAIFLFLKVILAPDVNQELHAVLIRVEAQLLSQITNFQVRLVAMRMYISACCVHC